MTNYGLMQIIGGVNDEGKQEAVKVIDGVLQTTGSSEGGGSTTPFTLTLSISTKTDSGTIASGAKSLAFGNTGNGNITLAGGTITPGTVVDAPIIAGGTYNPVAYDATISSLLVIEIR